METNEISLHQLKVYEFVASAGKWVTSKDAVLATGVQYRTVADHMKRLVGVGIFDLAEVFPSHHYRLSPLADKRNKTYLQRLIAAKEVFGDELVQPKKTPTKLPF